MKRPENRKPGEFGFALFLAVASLILLYNAYDIAGFKALSSPGAIPMATTLAMVITSVLVAMRTFASPLDRSTTFWANVLPARVIIIGLMLLAYAFALKPIGFLPTSAVFLILSIKILSHRSWVFSVGIGLFSLLVIFLIFRIVFTVLMPAGIVPEGEMLAWIRNLISGGN